MKMTISAIRNGPVFHVPAHAERRSCRIDPGAIVQYWHGVPPKWAPFARAHKTPKCVESLDSHRDALIARTPAMMTIGNCQFLHNIKESNFQRSFESVKSSYYPPKRQKKEKKGERVQFSWGKTRQLLLKGFTQHCTAQQL